MIYPVDERRRQACLLLDKWGIDPYVVAEAGVNERGYWRFGATFRDGPRERHWTAWPDEFPTEDFLSLLPVP